MAYPIEGFKISTLDHHGLVAGMYDELRIGETLDASIHQDHEQRHLSIGNLVKGMVINGLGFTNQTLYLTPNFFEKVPVERLIGPSVSPEMFNEHALGRCLDTLYENDIETLYCKVSMQAMNVLGLQAPKLHLDSSSLHVHGEYKDTDTPNSVNVTYGFSKDHRPDLKQIVLNLITENKAGIPLLMAPADGNSEDKKGFREVIKQHIKQMQDAKFSYLIADSALYSAETLKACDSYNMKWITRVPETLNDAKWALKHIDESTMIPLKEGYKYTCLHNRYANISQRWLVIHSQAKQYREQKKLIKTWSTATQKEFKAFQKLQKKKFACSADAEAACIEFAQTLQYGILEQIRIEKKITYKKSGRPTEQSEIKCIDYYPSGNLIYSQHSYAQAFSQLGCFIIACNENDTKILSDLECFNLYKDQNKNVERGFRFIKDPLFMLDNLFLKSSKRLMALLMVMTVCLMVYAALEYKIRQQLHHQSAEFPNQKKKMIQNPTARWVLFYFGGISLLWVPDGTKHVTNMNNHHHTIVDILGKPYKYYYS